MKKLKKLILKKETIANLNEDEMKNIVGGYRTGLPLTCAICTTTLEKPKTYNCQTDDCPHTQPPRCCEYGCCETTNC